MSIGLGLNMFCILGVVYICCDDWAGFKYVVSIGWGLGMLCLLLGLGMICLLGGV